MRRMRWLICGLAVSGVAQQASAADLGDAFLRGSSTVINAPSGSRWGGVYFGAQGGYAMQSTDFGNGASSLIRYLLRNSVIQDQVASWTTLPKADTVGPSYGGFIGYNQQWGEVVLGIEANYNRTSLLTTATDTLARSILNNGAAPAGHDHTYNMVVSADASVRVTDIMTFRARAGWDAGAFLPYAFIGAAVGRADASRSATVSGSLTDSFSTTTTVTDPFTGVTTQVVTPHSVTTVLNLPGTLTDSQTGMFAYGWTVGLGVDWCLMQNLFVRAEWEWVQFAPIKDMNVHVNTIRTAIALKF